MRIRKLARVAPVIAALAIAAPVSSASAQTGPGSMIPCYPEPAFCGPSGQPWSPFFPFEFQPLTPTTPHFGPGPVQLQPHGFGPGPVQLPFLG